MKRLLVGSVVCHLFNRIGGVGAVALLASASSCAPPPSAAKDSRSQAAAVDAPEVAGVSSIPEAPAPPKAEGNPLAGAKLWVNPESQAALKAKQLTSTDPAKAAAIEKLATRPSAAWLGEWSGDVEGYVRRSMSSAQGQMPVFVIYNLPYRDCGNYSKGGLATADKYRRWSRAVASGIGDGAATVIVEPDALGLLDKCLSPAQQSERLSLVKDAVRVLRQNPKTAVYIDAGHPHWVPAQTMAKRLQEAGVEDAHGFALNTSNYVSLDENLSYGAKLSSLVGGAHFVVDTSRNGNGSAPKDEWCNPAGRHIGVVPTTETGNALADAYLWVKPPGESDGECNGGPAAGMFWLEQALELAQ